MVSIVKKEDGTFLIRIEGEPNKIIARITATLEDHSVKEYTMRTTAVGKVMTST